MKDLDKQKLQKIIVTLIIGLLLSVGGNGYFVFTDPSGEDHKVEIQNKNEEIEKLKHEKESLKTENKVLTNQNRSLESQKEVSEKKADEMEQKAAEQAKENELLERQQE